MTPEQQNQVRQFVVDARNKGISDIDITKYMAQQGWLQQMKPETFGAYKPTATPGVSFSREAETAAVQGFQQPKEKEPGFIQGVSGIISERGENFAESLERQRLGQQTAVESGVQLAGQTVGAVFDIAFEGAKSILGLAPESVKEVVGTAGKAFLDTEIAQAGLQALQGGVEMYEGWKAENQRAAANLEAVLNIASIIPVGAGTKSGVSIASKTGKPLLKTGTAIEKSAIAKQAARTADEVADLISPPVKKTKLPKGKNLLDIEEGGIFQGRKFSTDNPLDREIIETVSQIPGIEKGNVLAKGQTMERYIASEAEKLVKLTKEKDVIFPKQELLARLNSVKEELAKTPLLTGDAGKSAERVVAEYSRRIQQADGKLSEVLKVRKDMDAWVRKFAGDKALSGEKANAMSIAVKELRDATNDYLISKSPVGSEIQNSLKRQSNTFRALDNVKPKALNEAGSKIERLINTVSEKLGVRSKIVQTLGLFTGVGVFGAMSAYAPVATGFFLGSAGLSGIYKAAVSPTVRKKIGTALKGIGKELDRLPTTNKTAVREGLEVLVGLGIISASEARLSDTIQEE